MAELSIIIPFVREYPQVAFTANNLFCELWRSGIDFEIIVVDNWCKELADQQGLQPDKGSDYMKAICEGRSWLKYLHYDKKLSHWQAKNLGVKNSTGQFLLFVDSHCIVSKNSIVEMFNFYKKWHEQLHGTLHLPLAYMLEKPGLELIYKLVQDIEHGIVHYSFTRHRIRNAVHRMPCMSTCGMMMTRKIYNKLGGWPEELGIYGGGENFINFTLATMGYNINIFPADPLYHFADKRGYSWNYTDFHRNRIISSYMYGGYHIAKLYAESTKGRPGVFNRILNEVVEKCQEHRDHVKESQVCSIEEWVRRWTDLTPETLQEFQRPITIRDENFKVMDVDINYDQLSLFPVKSSSSSKRVKRV